ncbi:hypothetical protein MAPG_10546, partial [Magnaporthiopsis poae ATCC 64411]
LPRPNETRHGYDSAFLSEEPKVGDPSYEWESFKSPKLREYPKPPTSLRFKKFIGGGEEGVVFRARTESDVPVAVKVYFINEQPPQPDYSNWPGARYWPFQHESVNCAVLDMMKTSLRVAAENNRPLYLHPNPKTRNDAI